MPFYLYQWAYKDPAIQAMLETPQDRPAELRKAVEAFGGRVHHFFFAFGEYDSYVTVELPDNKSAAALALAVATTGSVSKYVTTVLMTSAEAVEAMKAASKVSYTPPK